MRLLFGQCVNPISLASLKRREIDRICKHNGYLSLKQFKKLKKKIGISLKKFHSMSAIHQTKVFGIVSDLLLTHASFSTMNLLMTCSCFDFNKISYVEITLCKISVFGS